ncbi:Eukaryotic translation initiation factor 3 subunit C [Pteropus alecto]|uniref:Eukaryotic translation initiation factor 3 subunit C n=2 Tax=Pteropodidae TaxID=9398 RepID=L5KJJ2_PTEAL|nr:Eukaryotic translation initiation factor 3 subunit C [Pteropus alecto]
MSRFFTTGSDSESESSLSGEELVTKPVGGNYGKQPLLLSEDEEDTKRVVRSAKDKRFEELTNLIRTIRNAMKIRDVTKCLEEFELLGKAYGKAKSIVDKEGVPRFYIRILADLEDYLNELWEDKEGKKKMNKNNAKALSTLRQKIRKYNRDFESHITNYKQNPEQSADEDAEKNEEDSEGSSDEDEDEDGVSAATFLKKKSEAPSGESRKFLKKLEDEDEDSEDSEDDEDWDTGSTSSDSDSEEEEGKQTVLASKFLKKAPATEEDKKAAEKKREDKAKKKHDRKSKRLDEEEEDNEGGEWERVRGGVPLVKEKPKMFAKGTEITHAVVIKKLNEILQARGKKGTDRAAQIELLQLLVQIASENNLGEGVIVKIKFNIIASLYDYNPNLATYMKPEMWQKCLDCINELMDILFANPNIFVGENILEESENLHNVDQPLRVRGCILTLVERMDEEFTKIMQNTHSPSDLDQVENEGEDSAVLMERLCKYIYAKDRTDRIRTCAILCHIYHHALHSRWYQARDLMLMSHLQDNIQHADPPVQSDLDQVENEGEDSAVLMERLCKYIYAKDRTDRIRTCAILCHIYHHALHSRWYQARDLMLMSHLQDNIQHADPPVQILYNRTMVQLGICAFRQGLTKDAHNALLDIQSSGRAKELLGQGLLLRSLQERNQEQEKVERRRQVPFHLHINLELLECVYLVSAMLLEIPYMAAHESDARRRMISKQFHHQLRVGERQPLLGPPESMREHVVAASKAMKMGDWKTCHSFIINEKMNGKVWDLFPEADKVRTMLVRKIQEESLRTYLFTYSSVYDSISMETLSDMFELDLPTVHSIISKMIINEELMASLDQPTQTVVMHRTEPTAQQNLALQLAEKLGSLVENNERVFDHKQGTYGGYFRDQKDGYRKNEGYMRRGGYRQQQSQTAY